MQRLSLALYTILLQTKPQSGFVQNCISCKGFVQNGKFKMFIYKDMLCSFYDLRLTALVFRQKQNNTSPHRSNSLRCGSISKFPGGMAMALFVGLQGSIWLHLAGQEKPQRVLTFLPGSLTIMFRPDKIQHQETGQLARFKLQHSKIVFDCPGQLLKCLVF